MADVSSWFYEQLQKKASSPERRLLVGGSDYSTRVVTWPRIKRSERTLNPLNVRVALANEDGGMNFFFNDIYTMQRSGGGGQVMTADFGFTHPDSDTEWLTMYTGNLTDVKFEQTKCILFCEDKIKGLVDRKVGGATLTDIVTYTNENPGAIAWDLLTNTSYGALSAVASTSNPDIDYAAWSSWSNVFSADTVYLHAHFEGEPIPEALEELARVTDSAIFVTGEGKITFIRYGEASANDYVYNDDTISAMDVYIDPKLLVNRFYVYCDYDYDAQTWGFVVTGVNSTSIINYGVREEIHKSEMVWYPTSATALPFADRRVDLYGNAPKEPEISTALVGVHREIGETFRMIDSFMNIDSGTPWRIFESEINMNDGSTKWKLSSASARLGFYLDVDSLDHTSRFLL